MQEICIRHGSRMANRMLQYLTAHAVATQAGGPCLISGYDIEEWALQGPRPSAGHRKWPKLDAQRVDVPWLFQQLERGGIEKLKIDAVSSDIDLLPSRADAAELLRLDGQEFFETSADQVVIHIRLEDILQPGRHVGYGPLPISWYRQILEDNDLQPVFVGQFGDDRYSAALKGAFPTAIFIEGGTVRHDFLTIQNAHNVILGVSTFSWLAAWLGAKRRIFYPVLGMLNPIQYPQINLLPANDPRYQAHEFPQRKWLASEDEIDALIHAPSQSKRLTKEAANAVVAQGRAAAEADISLWRERFIDRTVAYSAAS